MRSNLSVLGIYNFDDSIFANFNVPDGMDKQLAIDAILFRCAELEILYPDADFLKYAIGSWSSQNQAVWEKLFKTTQLEYNPIWNKDGTISEVETTKGAKDSKGYDNAFGESHREQDTSLTVDGRVAGFNSEELVDKSQDVSTGDNSEDVSAKNSSVFGHKDDEEQQRSYVRKEQGNIGVTTTQSMIEEEREVSQFNMYDYISMDFKNRFCLLVY